MKAMLLGHQSLLLFPLTSFPKPPTLSLFCTTAAATATATAGALSVTSTQPYGPSLHKGHKPPILLRHQHENEPEPLINEENFTRQFRIAALRVPSEQCFDLENRLRGHLLNWPRVRNIARASGDEIDDNLKQLLPSNIFDEDEDDSLVSLNRRIYGKSERDGERLSPVLSRPKRRKNQDIVGDKQVREKKGGEVYAVEVVEDSELEVDDLSGLLGDDFNGRKWRGSTRLLLLDERYGDKELDKMPEAIKAVFNKGGSESMTSAIELVRCNLTLFYTYWQMNEILEALLPAGLIIPSPFETVSHIAHLNLRDEHHSHKKLIAKLLEFKACN